MTRITTEADRRWARSYRQDRDPVRMFLDCSTCHVSKATADWLDGQSAIAAATHRTGIYPDMKTIAATTWGWFLYADEFGRDQCFPDDLCDVMNFARSRGCNYVMLDRMGQKFASLREYDW